MLVKFANLVWAQNSNAMSNVYFFLHHKIRPWELLIPSQGIAIQILYFRSLNYLNLMIKSFLKMGS